MAPVFHTLRIARVRRETVDAVSLSFDVPPDLAEAYAFRPGQFLTLRATIGGADIRRTYSICAGPGEPIRVGIKRVPGGVFSTWANEALQAGDTLRVMTPDGRFVLPEPSEAPRTIAAFAAGSGITPILSILKTVLATEPEARFFLFYGNRTTEGILFRDEIEDLKDRHLSRLSVFHVLSREAQDVPVLNGHLDAAKVRLLLRSVLPAGAIDQAFICGPQPMIEDLPQALRDIGVPVERVHVERFAVGPMVGEGLTSAPPVAVPAAVSPPAPTTGLDPATHTTAAPQRGRTDPGQVAGSSPAMTEGEGTAATTTEQSTDHSPRSDTTPTPTRVTLIHEGAQTTIPVRPDEPIIDAAIRAGRDLPYSCKAGMCCTCRARVTEGRVEMAVNYSLEPWELEAGFVLTCQARPLTPTVTVDFDAV